MTKSDTSNEQDAPPSENQAAAVAAAAETSNQATPPTASVAATTCTAPAARPAAVTIFISCSRLSRCWSTIAPTVLTSSLFLFGSKYSWIFPSTKEEMNDARRQPGRYHLMSKEFKQLIQEKYEKGQVFFLKKEELEYVMYPGPADPHAYERCSAWLSDIHGLPPLQLDRNFWNHEFSGEKEKKLKVFQFSQKKEKIIQNFEKGWHEYNELLQLLATSCGDMVNPRLQ